MKQSNQTVISLEQGTENTFENASGYISEDGEEESSAAIFSKDDLSINGAGKLIIQANYKDGIAGRDHVLVTGGNIAIQAMDDGIVGRDLLAIRDAEIKIHAGGDGVKSSNDEDEQKGHSVLQSGALSILAGSDGIQSECDVLVVEREYTITAGGGSPETVKADQEFYGGGMPGGGAPRTGIDFSQVQQYISGAISKEELLEGMEESDLPDGMTIEEVEAMLDQMAEGGMPQAGRGMKPPTEGQRQFDAAQNPPEEGGGHGSTECWE